MYQLRVGGDGEVEVLDGLIVTIEYLASLRVGRVIRWRPGGVETQNYWGDDYIVLHRPGSDLLPDERAIVEDALVESHL